MCVTPAPDWRRFRAHVIYRPPRADAWREEYWIVVKPGRIDDWTFLNEDGELEVSTQWLSTGPAVIRAVDEVRR